MVYNNKFVVVVKSRGRVLRERGETVYIPFGSEYSILLKNLESRDAVANVSIDGDDVMDGNEVIVRANSEVELEGFMKGSRTSHKFRFIEKTDQIADYRGNKPADGLVRVAFKFCKQKVAIPEITWYSDPPRYGNYYDPHCFGGGSIYNVTIGDSIGSSTSGGGTKGVASNSCNVTTSNTKGKKLKKSSFTADRAVYSANFANEDGITVKGSKSNQGFVHGWIDTLEDVEHTIVLQLKGKTASKKRVKKPLTVRAKIQCGTCGKKSSSSAKFCSRCSTALFN